MLILDEIAKQVSTSGAKAVITNAEIAHIVAKATKSILPPNAPFIVIDDGTEAMPSDAINFNVSFRKHINIIFFSKPSKNNNFLQELIEKGKSLSQISSPSRSPDDIAVLPYSSGTTGLPKGVMLSHTNLVANMIMLEKSTEDEIFNKIGTY